uniref:Putative ovule protein n=1 Tax=Solanum chacoense TaxID=4108 RepID=A0A0V0H518_SOLCH
MPPPESSGTKTKSEHSSDSKIMLVCLTRKIYNPLITQIIQHVWLICYTCKAAPIFSLHGNNQQSSIIFSFT